MELFIKFHTLVECVDAEDITKEKILLLIYQWTLVMGKRKWNLKICILKLVIQILKSRLHRQLIRKFQSKPQYRGHFNYCH